MNISSYVGISRIKELECRSIDTLRATGQREVEEDIMPNHYKLFHDVVDITVSFVS